MNKKPRNKIEFILIILESTKQGEANNPPRQDSAHSPGSGHLQSSCDC